MKHEMININANLVDEPVFSSFEKDGEEIVVANFTLVKKYGKGKEYINCLKKAISFISLDISKSVKKTERLTKTL